MGSLSHEHVFLIYKAYLFDLTLLGPTKGKFLKFYFIKNEMGSKANRKVERKAASFAWLSVTAKRALDDALEQLVVSSPDILARNPI